ncbi:dihydroflavonol 4-reductase-like isoform X2 [Vigna angularis]|uniref:dihydroflavonol 4-reductase-like isoform X2 n=1 Tax=Phaseolus angularis TaxID=3914 RepID=UPI0022B4631B|nr:dihydroflavonol 4-reductase-like isoform X2 [Vigna angularis]
MKKVKPLLEIPGAESKLSLWKANLAEEGSFDEAIKGCIGVFHVATPIEFESKDPENEVIKPAIRGVIDIMKACLKAKTVFGSSFKVAGCSIISRKKMQIITPHCRRQLGSYECGYYVMKHMHTIICTNIIESWNKIFNDSSPMEAADMEDIRRNWASFILSVSRNLATLK